MLQALFFLLISTLLGYHFSNYVIQKKARRWHHIGIKKGYHIHHSMYGVASILLIPITINNLIQTMILLGFGIGIILEHTVHDGFVFINKVSKELEKDVLSVELEEYE